MARLVSPAAHVSIQEGHDMGSGTVVIGREGGRGGA